jgi:hypothetical protein
MKYSGIFDAEDEELLREVLMDAKAKKSKAKEEDDEDEEDDDNMDSGSKAMKTSRSKMSKDEDEEDEEDDRADAIWMGDRIDSLESELSALRAKCDAQDKLLGKLDSIDIDALVAERVDAVLETYNELRPYLPEEFKLDGNATVAGMKMDAIKEMDSDADVNEETPEAVLDSVLSVLTRYHRKDSTDMQRRILNTPEPKADAKGGWEGMKPKSDMKPLTYGKSKK